MNVCRSFTAGRRRLEHAGAVLGLTLGLLGGLGPGFTSSARAEHHTSTDLNELDLDELMHVEVVSSASKFAQEVLEAPASVSIVTAQEIRNFGYQTLAEVLRGVRGFYVSYERNYYNVGVRGFSRPADWNTRILLLVDGHRINENIYHSAGIGGEFPVDLDLIERIEIVRGPTSSLYGTNAFFGVVNVITRSTRNWQGVELAGGVSSYSTVRGRGTVGITLKNGMELLASGTLFDSGGHERLYYPEFDDPGTNNGISEDNDGEEFSNALLRASWRGFTLQGVYGSRLKTVPTASYETLFNDSQNHTVDDWGYLTLQYERFVNRSVELMARLSYNRYEFTGDYPYLYDDQPPTSIYRSTALGVWWGGEVNVSASLPGHHRLTFGGEFRDNLIQDQLDIDIESGEIYLDDRRSSNVWAVYAEAGLNLSQKLHLNVGLRHDWYSTFGGSTNPRLGLVYNPTAKSAIKFLYGRAFRAPNSYEIYGGGEPNLDLEPETIQTAEIVWEQYLGEHLRFSGSGFMNRLEQLISPDPELEEGWANYDNIEKIDSRGLEMELELKLARGFRGHFGYTFQHTEDAATGEMLSNSPQHLAKLALSAPIVRDKLWAGLELLGTSSRRTLDGERLPAFVVPNLTLRIEQLAEGLDLSVSLYNLSDMKYADPASTEHEQNAIEQDGRSLRLKVIYGF